MSGNEAKVSSVAADANTDSHTDLNKWDVGHSSVSLTPDTTPTKPASPHHSAPSSPAALDDHTYSLPSSPSSCDDDTSTKKTKAAARKNKTSKKSTSKPSKTLSTEQQTKVKSKAKSASSKPRRTAKSNSSPKRTTTKEPKNVPSKANHLMTEYYPIRRSNRVTAKELKKRKNQSMEEAILSNKEEGLKVVEMDGKGRGVVSVRPFSKGEFVVEYAGDLMDLGSAREREQQYAIDPRVGCYMYYFNHNNKNYCVDATAESGRLGRLVNHSRYGNCVTRVVPIKQRPHLILVAGRDIEAGEEMLYDYGDRSKESLATYPWLAS